MLGTRPEASVDPIDQIVLDIKVLAGTNGWGPLAQRRLRERIVESHDEDVKQFLSTLERRRPLRPWGQLLVGAGELVFSAFLTVIGLVLLVPSILGFTSRGEIARYLSDLSLGLGTSSLSDPLIVAIGFGFSLFLLLAALYTLRLSSRSFRESSHARLSA